MRIPLQIIQDQLRLAGIIRAPRYHVGTSTIDFVIDTGSNRDTIGYGDVLRLNIPQSVPCAEVTRIGGQTFNLHELRGVRLAFLDANNGTQRFIANKIFLSLPAKKNEQERMEAAQIPSILGLDFLKVHKLRLVCDPAHDEAYLEPASAAKT